MITKIWNNIELYCGNHEVPVKMTIKDGGLSLFYACPKYYPENRDEHELACVNRINFVDFEKFVNHISSLLEEAENNNSSLNLTNYKWIYKSIEFNIIYHDEELIKVVMINKRAIK